MNIQISFQGGGARLVLLLAAAEAVRELEKEGVIRVTRIAGTSAGAIVGAFLAGELDLNGIRVSLSTKEGQELLRKFKVPKYWFTKLWAGLRLGMGRQMWKDATLRNWIRKQFEPLVGRDVWPTFAQLKKKLIVVSTSLDSGTADKRTDGDLTSALIDSAGLPFCFKTWGSGGNTVHVDGGLCENLPVEDLIAKSETDGRVVAFSFAPA